MKFQTAGESHGKYMNVVVYDVVSGINLDEDIIDYELMRRSVGPGRSLRQSTETNKSKITSGVSGGKTTGAPINIVIENNFDNETTSCENDNFYPRCGHADLSGVIKYNFDDCENVSERASGRETALRVAAGAVAKEFLSSLNAEVYSYVKSIGSVSFDDSFVFSKNIVPNQADIAISEVLCPDEDKSKQMLEQIERAKKAGDSLGGEFRCVCVGVVPGIGSYTQLSNRLDGKIMGALGCIPSVKSVSVGDSSYMSQNVGSAIVDQLSDDFVDTLMRTTNYAGGIEGGMTTGMPIIASCSVKALPTVKKALRTINLSTMQLESYKSCRRTDGCVVPNVGVVAEAELSFIIANGYIEKFGSDCLSEIKYSLDTYKQRLKRFI